MRTCCHSSQLRSANLHADRREHPAIVLEIQLDPGSDLLGDGLVAASDGLFRAPAQRLAPRRARRPRAAGRAAVAMSSTNREVIRLIAPARSGGATRQSHSVAKISGFERSPMSNRASTARMVWGHGEERGRDVLLEALAQIRDGGTDVGVLQGQPQPVEHFVGARVAGILDRRACGRRMPEAIDPVERLSAGQLKDVGVERADSDVLLQDVSDRVLRERARRPRSASCRWSSIAIRSYCESLLQKRHLNRKRLAIARSPWPVEPESPAASSRARAARGS